MEIFVFGSNLAGRHGKGAALYARENYGAIRGVAMGPMNRCYAIPTKDRKLRTLSLREIESYVNVFINWAHEHPEMEFRVTRIGCGFVGYADEQIAPMFRHAPRNCKFSERWRPYLGDERCYFME